MKTYENYIELSDEHLMWKLNNDKLSNECSEWLYTCLVEKAYCEFKSIYGVHFEMLGRSGRHVCVENTPKNRQNYCRMVRTIKRQQKELIDCFNSATEI